MSPEACLRHPILFFSWHAKHRLSHATDVVIILKLYGWHNKQYLDIPNINLITMSAQQTRF